MSGSKLVQDALKFRYRHSKEARFWLKDESIVPVAQSVLSIIDKHYEPLSEPNIEILRRHCRGSSLRKLAFRIECKESPGKSYVVKVFPLRCLKHRLKYHRMRHHRFGFGEAANLLIANERGLKVPKVYGYGHIYGSYWLVKTSIVIVEYLAHQSSIEELLKSCGQDQNKCAQILNHTVPIFAGLYKAKCNHIDVNLGAIMFSLEDSQQDGSVVDFEYARFYDARSPEILMSQAAYFAKRWSDFVPAKAINDWLSKLLDAIEVKDDLIRDKMIERFGYYFSTDLSRRERMHIC